MRQFELLCAEGSQWITNYPSADSEFTSKTRQTRKEKFLGRMVKLVPWPHLIALIEQYYPKAGNGLHPYPLETMLRIHCMQHW